MQRRILYILVSIAFVGVLAVTGAWAGSPHFVSCSVERTDDTLCVLAKEAGLGDEEQINVQVSATALCINSGGNHPKAVNKASVSAEGILPVQNGQAVIDDADLCVTATFQPSCSPPMEVQFTNVSVTDLTNGISCNISATF